MVNELNALERKIAEVSAFCRALRVENIELRHGLAAVNGEKQRLVERIEIARVRLAALASQLPGTKDESAPSDV
jgi:hypothetical protein